MRPFQLRQRTNVGTPGLPSPGARVRVGRTPWLPPPQTGPVNAPVLSLKSETESPSARRVPGPSHRRHVRTIKEVQTTVTRIITDVYYEDGKEVERTVSEVAHTRTRTHARAER